MVNDRKFDTRVSLLDRLRTIDPHDASWQEFESRYGNLLKSWCKHWGVNVSDIDDVVQETLIAVISSLDGFQHRGPGSFRSWMKAIGRRCFAQLLQRANRNPVAGAANIELCDQACQKLVDTFDQEAQRELLALSAIKVKQRVNKITWQSFELTALQGIAGATAAKMLDIDLGTLYVYRGRVQRMIAETIREMDQ